MVLKYIDEHLEEALTTDVLARVAGYSEYHFIRMFKSHMNVTLMEYVCKRRLIKASEDILSGEKIVAVAMKFSVENLGGSAMSHVFFEPTKVGTIKEELFAILQKKMKANGVYVEQNKLDKIYRTYYHLKNVKGKK